MTQSNKSSSSQRWLTEHFNDSYVKQAKSEGFRSRSVYKLAEMQKKDKIIKPNNTVIDLGAAPGSWSQYARQEVGSSGKVIALDILALEPITGVNIIKGDFTEQQTLDKLMEIIGNQPVDLVLSDLAPNISGVKSVDQAKASYLAELALDLAQNVLRKNGGLLVKVFQGTGYDEYLRRVRASFKSVVVRKPAASRPRSREVYLLAKEYK